ncbi:MAG: DNA methyltransferase [Candidatus Hodarchaeales archaeon]
MKSPYSYNFKPVPTILTDFERKLYHLEQIRYIEHPESFYKETAYNLEVDDKKTHYSYFSNLKLKLHKFSINSGYLTHGFSIYRGSFHAQMIRGLINFCNLPKNSTILDLFCGSGTTLVEALLLGFNAIGIDINPIAYLTSRVKTELLCTLVNKIVDNNSNYFNSSYYEQYKHSNFAGITNLTTKELFYLFNFMWAYKDHVRFNSSLMKAFQKRFTLKTSLLKKFELMKHKLDLQLNPKNIKVFWGDNLSRLQQLPSNSLDLILTSPPYLHAIDYIEEDKTQLSYFFDKESIQKFKNNSVGRWFHNLDFTEDLYWSKMEDIIQELHRIIRSKAKIIFIIGTLHNLKERYVSLFINSRFEIKQIFQRKAVNHRKATKSLEYIIIVERKS